ncbi:AsnC family protein [Terasakiella sp. A23]|uniref:siroheme decarboxylase subunit beta n=1 Tax=Terasakiella sp. FCG-A23 TaxID=3080561 RepID=UPI0029557A26|nr:AsnC family protein [Terasakiella sp. A23]MDV7341284.1 AsnC family protein [Terasakiella sp. A23]
MALTQKDLLLLDAIKGGLPLSATPYADIGAEIAMSESEVMDRLASMQDMGVVKRFGVIVRHHELGYRCNGMCVWDIPDDKLVEIGQAFSKYDFVTLCYQRPRRLPDWPYNLFCMIHGKERTMVRAQARMLAEDNGLLDIQRDILFSTKRLKQRGAHYALCRPADVSAQEVAE